MAITHLMLPSQTPTTRDRARQSASALPELRLIVAGDEIVAARAVGLVEAMFGAMPCALLREAARFCWIQALHTAPPARRRPPGGARRS